MAEVIGVCAVILVVLLSGAGSSPPRWRLSAPHYAALCGLGIAALFLLKPAHLSLLFVAAGSALGVFWLLGRRRRRARQRAISMAVQVVCNELAEDLRMGRAPAAALAASASRAPFLRPVAVAAELHHDVPKALREVAQIGGADGLRAVAAAWQVSSRTGSALAEALGDVARLLSARERRARLVDAELAAARATGIVVSGLPLLVLGLGSGLGTDPWSFFLSGIGPVVLGVAAALLLAGWAWLDWLAARALKLP